MGAMTNNIDKQSMTKPNCNVMKTLKSANGITE